MKDSGNTDYSTVKLIITSLMKRCGLDAATIKANSRHSFKKGKVEQNQVSLLASN